MLFRNQNKRQAASGPPSSLAELETAYAEALAEFDAVVARHDQVWRASGYGLAELLDQVGGIEHLRDQLTNARETAEHILAALNQARYAESSRLAALDTEGPSAKSAREHEQQRMAKLRRELAQLGVEVKLP